MDESRLFCMVCSERTRSNGQKLEHRKFPSNKQKNFPTVRGGKGSNYQPLLKACVDLHKLIIKATQIKILLTQFLSVYFRMQLLQ